MITENLIDSSHELLKGVFNGTITLDQVKEQSENRTLLDNYKMMHPSIFKAFEFDNQEKIKMFLAKINRRDTLEEKKDLIKREKDSLLGYLESENVSEEIRNYNKFTNQLVENLEYEIVKYENPSKQNEVQNETQKNRVNDLIQLMKDTNFLENSFNPKELSINIPSLEGKTFEEIKEQLREKIDFNYFIHEGLNKDGIFNEKAILQEVRESLYIHSQEQYYELLRIEEKKITGETEPSETVIKDTSKKAFLEIPITVERGNTDTYTKLTVSQTAILFDYLSQAEAIFSEINHVDYLKKINKAKAIQALTGYSHGRITDAIEDNTPNKKTKDIREVRKIVEKIKVLITRDLT